MTALADGLMLVFQDPINRPEDLFLIPPAIDTLRPPA